MSRSEEYQNDKNNGHAPARKRGLNISDFIQQGKMDMTFFGLVLLLLVVGLICLFSSSYAYALQNYGSSYHFIKKQVIFAVIGVVIMLIT